MDGHQQRKVKFTKAKQKYSEKTWTENKGSEVMRGLGKVTYVCCF